MAGHIINPPEWSPTAMDVRESEVPAMREEIFAKLYLELEGVSVVAMAHHLNEFVEFVSMILTDAYLKGELVKITPPGASMYEGVSIEQLFRLSPQKWIEMAA